MSLSHEFFLISDEYEIVDRYEWYYTNRYIWKEKVELTDGFVQYLMDFLNWTPSYNPETKEEGIGLNYYGVTIINKLGSDKLIRILDKLSNIFDEAPEIFSLRGETIWVEEKNGEGYWEQTRNRLKREKIKNDLENLKRMAIKVSKNDAFIMHFGI